jgi:gamma-glutamylputrescine oxidase
MSSQDAEILVIGAGLTGAMIASHLANQGANVAVVDAQSVGKGATKRALGLASPVLHPDHFGETARSVATLAQLAAKHQVTPQIVSVLHVAGDEPKCHDLKRTFDEIGAHVSQAQWEANPDVVPHGFGAGVLVRNCIIIDPLTLTERLLNHKRIALKQGMEIHDIRWHRGKTHALAEGHTLRADAVVLATNAAVGLLSHFLAGAVKVMRGAMFVSQPLSLANLNGNATRTQMLLQTPLIIDYGRLSVLHGKDNRARVSAWNEEAQTDPSANARHFVNGYLPSLSENFESQLSSVTTTTPDGAPFVDKLEVEGNVYFAIGLGLHGLAWSVLVAEAMTELVGGE